MLATLTDAPPLDDPRLVYEPKYDGIRALVAVTPGRGGPRVTIWSRNGNDKSAQFPSIVHALQAAAARLEGPIVLDGELVALDEQGRPAGFQRLQGRIHLSGAHDVERVEQDQPVALIAFDLLQEGHDDLCRLPLTARRARLEQLFARTFGPKRGARAATSRGAGQAEGTIRLSEQVAGSGRALYERALAEGWEGLIVKDAAAPYQAGRRSPAWRKFKVVQEQEFVVGGWTEPRQTRAYFGALLLGVYEGDDLVYVGHTGTGFNHAELERVWRVLKARETPRSPFSTRIKTNEPAHWARPELVAQIKFTEWTADDKLRHPVYLGLRDDKDPREVVRERARTALPSVATRSHGAAPVKHPRPRSTASAAPRTGASAAPVRRSAERGQGNDLDAVVEQLRALEAARKDGTIALPNGDRLGVTNLHKVFYPDLKITKGDLLRYYVEVSPYILPAVTDRPLVMKRFPNGIAAGAFYQQRQRLEQPPAGVRIETLPEDLDPIGEADARRFIGGSLTTLLYMTQIAAISQDPWFSRVQSPLDADHVAIDLDPTDDATFAQVLDVARWVRDELASLGVPGFPKTSGSSGLHVYIPLPRHTAYESGMLFCQIVATMVATRHPKVATVERTVARRPRGTVYVDFLQNILGKTLATAYSARASAFAGVSTPLTWQEIDERIDPRDFTIRTAPARFARVGDLWEGLRTAKPASLTSVFEKYSRDGGAATSSRKKLR
jgi:bifunctional non-homologous end joining protein LigD